MCFVAPGGPFVPLDGTRFSLWRWKYEQNALGVFDRRAASGGHCRCLVCRAARGWREASDRAAADAGGTYCLRVAGGALCAGSLLFVSLSVTLGVALGALIVVMNFRWLRRLVERAMSKGQKAKKTLYGEYVLDENLVRL